MAASTLLYILNPGDFHDVETFRDQREALDALAKAKLNANMAPRLYSFGALGSAMFCEYTCGNWYAVEASQLQVKIIEAVPTSRAASQRKARRR